MFRLNVHVPFSRIPLLSQATRQEGCLGTHSTQTINGCNAARYTRDDGQVAESGDWLYMTAHKQNVMVQGIPRFPPFPQSSVSLFTLTSFLIQ